MLVVDMHAPGVTVRPLRQMTGESHFNEVFLDDVRVPAANVIGEVNGGWRVARTMLAFERQALGGMGSSGGGRGGISALVAEARRATWRRRAAGGAPAPGRSAHRARWCCAISPATSGERGNGRSSGGEASILKLAMAQLVQDAAEVAVDIVGPSARGVGAPTLRGGRSGRHQLLNARSASIGGGTNEIVRNVIAERVLGLPRDVEVDARHPVPGVEGRDAT